MPKKINNPYILVPENELLKALPDHLRARFGKALYLMHDAFGEDLSWQDIANQSAISAYHFHRQFTGLFDETPGRYLSRKRLQVAVYQLINCPSASITQIAHQTGFSSSQALAKALKRELNQSAKAIRELSRKGTPGQTSALLSKLALRIEDKPLEYQLAESLPCEIVRYPKRWFVAQKSATKIKPSVSIVPVGQLEHQWQDIDIFTGQTAQSEEKSTFTLPAGDYLCCNVYVVADVGYDAAWYGLYHFALKHNHQIDEQGYCVELLDHVEQTTPRGATFSLQVSVLNA